ncbi:MAG: leucine-rich repeat domain-containing protein [Candidatus Amoebophilus sp.]
MKRINLTITNLQSILVILVMGYICACKEPIPTDSTSRQEENIYTQNISLASLDANSPDSLWEQFFAQRGMRRVGDHLFLEEDKSISLFRGRFGTMSITDAEAKEAIIGFIKYLHYRNITMRSINIVKDVLCELDLAIIEFASITEQFRHLESLTLYNNRIQDMPALIASLPNLKELRLDNNNIGQLPEQLGALTQLEKFQVSNNQLYELPSSITQLTNLTELDLSNNQFSYFPLPIYTAKQISIQADDTDEVMPVTNPFIRIRTLSLKNNQLREIPEYIGLFTNLERLYLDSNKIHRLPHTMAQLTNLSRLVLAHNELKELPGCMYPFITLGRLNACRNAWYQPKDLMKLTYKEIRKEAQKMLPTSLATLCMRCIVGPVEGLNNYTPRELKNLLPIGLSYRYLPYMYQKASYWKEGEKYVCFMPLGDLNIPFSMDFSFVTLADLDNLFEKIIKRSKEEIVFQKKE